MSYGLMAYTVDGAAIAERIERNDMSMWEEVVNARTEAFDAHEEWFAHEIEAGAPDSRTALKQLICQEPMSEEFGFIYGYAVKELCEHFGHSLPNTSLYPAHFDYIDAVDDILESLDAPPAVRLTRLAFGRSFVEFPPPDDFPGTGWIDAACAGEAHDFFAALHPARRKEALRVEFADEPDWLPGYVADTLSELEIWMETASARGWGVATFYH